MSYHALGNGAEESDLLFMQHAPAICPECSYLEGGTCHWCPDGSDIPGCQDCVERKRPAPPWYKRSEVMAPMAIAIATTVTAAVITQVALHRLRLGQHRRRS